MYTVLDQDIKVKRNPVQWIIQQIHRLGEVPVKDPRLEKIATLERSKQIIHAKTTFVDIAGLVKGASKGEGLGKQVSR